MTAEGALLAWMLAIPLLAAVAIALLRAAPNLREGATLVAGGALFLVVLQLFIAVGRGARPALTLAEVAPGLQIALKLEPLGAVFALLASGLWIVNALFSIGYMRANKERDQTRFYVFFAVAIAAAMGVASAGDLFSLFVFYEVLTLSTFPLVAHKGDEKARRGAGVYLTLLLSTSIGLLLPAIVATGVVAGGLAFTPGGLLPDAVDPALAGVILVLFAFGIGKAALMPVHAWLPNAMVAPTPVSALLHAVAVVKAGVFAMLKVSLYVFGPALMESLLAAKILAGVAAASIVIASLIALTKDNLKARLAYSTVSQLSYVTLGAMLATPAALLGAALQLVMHAFGKITLFMCAGAIYTGAKKSEISAMAGLGKAMPWTFAAYFAGALSVIGLPVFAGLWAKLHLMRSAAETESFALYGGALAISSVLNVAYLLPLAARGVFVNPPAGADKIKGAPWLAVLPPCLTAVGCAVLFFAAGPLAAYLDPVLGPGAPR